MVAKKTNGTRHQTREALGAKRGAGRQLATRQALGALAIHATKPAGRGERGVQLSSMDAPAWSWPTAWNELKHVSKQTATPTTGADAGNTHCQPMHAGKCSSPTH